MESRTGIIPRVPAELNSVDRLGTIKARLGIGRMEYIVDPGLYALGSPDESSPVTVTANYKMSFDRLRSALSGHDAWILVLDTKGINVWCAAGKGSFGTRELVEQIRSSHLSEIVTHRTLILPQLGAPGIAAHMVRKMCGFSVIYGPVRAEDLPAFMVAGMKATPEMREKTFPLKERAALIPMELIPALKPLAIILPLVFLIGGLTSGKNMLSGMLEHGLFAASMLLAGLFAGAVATPLLLPWLPGRAFSVKGTVAGGVTVMVTLLLLPGFPGVTGAVGPILFSLAFAAFLAMNFTGASTFTSLSGVRREMKRAVPIQIAAAAIGLVLWIGALISG